MIERQYPGRQHVILGIEEGCGNRVRPRQSCGGPDVRGVATEDRPRTRTNHVLILTRRSAQTLVPGPGIRVTVVGVRGSQVRIGIDAPKSVRVHREEHYARMQRNARTLSGSSSAATVAARNR